jgi:hypothetical protein
VQTSNAQTSNVNVGDTSLSAFDIPISENGLNAPQKKI